MAQTKRIFLVYLLLFFSVLLVVNVKTFLLPFILSFLIFFFYLDFDLIEATFCTFLFALPFENSIREWIIPVTPPLFTNVPVSSYQLFFGITPKIILGVLLLFLFLLPKYRSLHLRQKHPLSVKLSLVFFFASLLSSLFPIRTNIVFIGFVRLWLSIWFFITSFVFFSHPKVRSVFFPYIAALLLFSITFGLAQLILQKPLGRYIELTPSFSPLGYSTTDGPQQYRLSSFISHPVYFGSFLSILIPILISLFWSINSRQSRLYHLLSLTIIVSFIVLLGTLSRSTWLTALLIFVLYFFYQRHHPLLYFSQIFPKIKPKYLFFASLPIAIFIVIIFYPRFQSLGSLFSYYGNGSIRLELIKQSLTMIQASPLVGVGLNNFTFELINQNLPSNLYGFIVPVHNTIFLLLTELGIPVALIFLGFLFSLLWRPRLFSLPPLAFGCLVGALTFLISSQFHPLLNLDPTFDLFMFILGFLATC